MSTRTKTRTDAEAAPRKPKADKSSSGKAIRYASSKSVAEAAARIEAKYSEVFKKLAK